MGTILTKLNSKDNGQKTKQTNKKSCQKPLLRIQLARVISKVVQTQILTNQNKLGQWDNSYKIDTKRNGQTKEDQLPNQNIPSGENQKKTIHINDYSDKTEVKYTRTRKFVNEISIE